MSSSISGSFEEIEGRLLQVAREQWDSVEGSALTFRLMELTGNSILSQCSQISKDLDYLDESTAVAQSRLNNAVNDFYLTSNNQFIENNVAEEDDPLVEVGCVFFGESSCNPKEQEPSDNPEDISEKAMQFLQEQKLSSSSEESTILPASYSSRRLPYLIGSREFEGDDYIGLQFDKGPNFSADEPSTCSEIPVPPAPPPPPPNPMQTTIEPPAESISHASTSSAYSSVENPSSKEENDSLLHQEGPSSSSSSSLMNALCREIRGQKGTLMNNQKTKVISKDKPQSKKGIIKKDKSIFSSSSSSSEEGDNGFNPRELSKVAPDVPDYGQQKIKPIHSALHKELLDRVNKGSHENNVMKDVSPHGMSKSSKTDDDSEISFCPQASRRRNERKFSTPLESSQKSLPPIPASNVLPKSKSLFDDSSDDDEDSLFKKNPPFLPWRILQKSLSKDSQNDKPKHSEELFSEHSKEVQKPLTKLSSELTSEHEKKDSSIASLPKSSDLPKIRLFDDSDEDSSELFSGSYYHRCGSKMTSNTMDKNKDKSPVNIVSSHAGTPQPAHNDKNAISGLEKSKDFISGKPCSDPIPEDQGVKVMENQPQATPAPLVKSLSAELGQRLSQVFTSGSVLGAVVTSTDSSSTSGDPFLSPIQGNNHQSKLLVGLTKSRPRIPSNRRLPSRRKTCLSDESALSPETSHEIQHLIEVSKTELKPPTRLKIFDSSSEEDELFDK